jgi:hypothetical protein
MSISAVGSAPSMPNVQQARALDGDHKTASSQTVKTKDSDGDFKSISASSSPSSVSSNGVQAALTSLKIGG